MSFTQPHIVFSHPWGFGLGLGNAVLVPLVVQLNPPGERPLQGIGGSTVSLYGENVCGLPRLARCAGRFWPSVVIAGAVVLMRAPTTTGYMVYDRVFYLLPDAIQFVRPGLHISIQSAQIGSDGTISTDFQITDVPRPGRPPTAGHNGCQHNGSDFGDFLDRVYSKRATKLSTLIRKYDDVFIIPVR